MTRTPDHTSTSAPTDATWLSQPERGALLGMKLMLWVATVCGRWPARQVVRLIAAYYVCFDKEARRHSTAWLRTVWGREPRFREVYRHFFTFAQVTLDRLFLVQGKVGAFEVERTGNAHLMELERARQGAILLGAHLGSFEAMRAGAHEESFGINIVGNFANAKLINSLLDDLGSNQQARFIDISADPIQSTMLIRERLEEGEMVAVLGDRQSAGMKTVRVNFFGKPASFPAGPFILAALLDCPVYLVFGLYHEPNRYSLHCEPFRDKLVLPRRQRQEALEEVVQAYADRLEVYARQAPYCWFNFFDFWDEPQA